MDRDFGALWPCHRPRSPILEAANALLLPHGVEALARRQHRAHDRACRVVNTLGADPFDVFIYLRQPAAYDHFRIFWRGEHLFAKALATENKAGQCALDRERAVSEQAAQAGWAPEPIACAALPDVLLTRWLADKSLGTWPAVPSQTWAMVLRSLRAIHQSDRAERAGVCPRADDEHWTHLRRLSTHSTPGPLLLTDLQQRLAWIDAQQKQHHWPPAFVHGDAALANAFVHRERVLWIDWGLAGLSDPYRDLARLISAANRPADELAHSLALYLNATPTAAERRRLTLEVMAFDIDLYAHVQCYNPSPPSAPNTAWSRAAQWVWPDCPDAPPVRRAAM